MNISKRVSRSLKGIAIVLVIYTHVTSLVNGAQLFNVHQPLAAIGVWMFLLLSGYGLAKSDSQSVSVFISKRISSVYVPFLLVALIELLYWFFLAKLESPLTTLIYLLGLDCGWHYDQSMWFISYILFWYAIYLVTSKSTKSTKGLCIMVFGGVIFSVFILAVIFPHSARIYALAFFFGVVLANYRFAILQNIGFTVFTIITCTVCFFLYPSFGDSLLFFWVYMFSSSFLLIRLIDLIEKALPNFLKPLSVLGEYSYDLYLWEYFLLQLINNQLKLSGVYALFVYLILLISFSGILHKLKIGLHKVIYDQ